MLKDYKNKEVLAEMKRQVNAAAKISDREARITFVLVHMISEHHELAESAGKPDGDNILFRFVTWCLSRFAGRKSPLFHWDRPWGPPWRQTCCGLRWRAPR